MTDMRNGRRWVFNGNLPRAPWIRVEIWPRHHSMWTKFRLANALQLHAGRLVVRLRVPWLRHSALALHPEAFQHDR